MDGWLGGCDRMSCTNISPTRHSTYRPLTYSNVCTALTHNMLYRLYAIHMYIHVHGVDLLFAYH